MKKETPQNKSNQTNQLRNSNMDLGEIYFFTATTIEWRKLFEPEKFKNIILNSLKYLVENKLIELYGFVIMPNHVHFIWQLIKKNGNENPDASFMKFTASQFKKELKENHNQVLEMFTSNKKDREFQFWQRDPLAIRIFNEKIFYQKLDYIHNNPITEHWKLASNVEDYKWSSAKFYLNGIDEFEILVHYKDAQ